MTKVEEPLTGQRLPWYRGVSGYAWLVLIVAALGWLFDTLDQQLFTLIRFRSLQDILSASSIRAPLWMKRSSDGDTS